MIVAQVQTLVLTRLPSACCFPVTFQSTYTKNAFYLTYIAFISDLVPAKSVAVDKKSRRIELVNTSHIVRGHVAIITKPSPHYVSTESTISGRDLVLISGLLPIFLHGCEIKSGWCLGTRLIKVYTLRNTVNFLPW